MKNKMLSIIVVYILCCSISVAQSLNNKLIDMGRLYNKYMHTGTPPKELAKDVENEPSKDVARAADFIVQAISQKNKLMTPEYLTLPDDVTLKNIYIIKSLCDNMSSNTPMDNNELIEVLSKKQITRYEMVDNYYGMLFLSVGCKNQISSYENLSFDLNAYGLEDEAEKAIFFLRCMEQCGNALYSYIYETVPSNTKIAYRYIKKFPRFNGQPYYKYVNFDFYDFAIVMPKDGPRSYKIYYMSQYYDTLMNHLICLNKQGGTDDEKKDLLENSILTNRKYYKYSNKQAILNNMFYPDIK